MKNTVLMFGSIGVVAETSDIQRRAYNRALSEAGVEWCWDTATYADLLEQSGGKERLSMLAAATGTELPSATIDRIHARKTELAGEEVRSGGTGLRPGVLELVALAKERDLRCAFVTSTYRPNIDAILDMQGGQLVASDFDCIVTRADVERGKPAPDAYLHALKRLGIDPSQALAIEDTADSVMAAKRAGITVIATPGELSAGQDFWQADLTLDALAGSDGEIDPQVLALLGRTE